MIRILSKIILKIGYFFIKISKIVYSEPQEENISTWLKDEGDKTLRMQYGLDEKSIVFDLGGYEGQWASDIFSKYCCYIYIFEPIDEFANQIKNRFFNNKKIFVFNIALGSKNSTTKISVEEDSSSIYKKGKSIANIKVKRAVDFFKEKDINKIDLMKVNIEGAEYDLLEHLIKNNFITNIRNIQVQFHNFIPEANKRMKKIQESLQKSHHLTYQYPFIWENWEINI
jgi:FkbM family methyltransferase